MALFRRRKGAAVVGDGTDGVAKARERDIDDDDESLEEIVGDNGRSDEHGGDEDATVAYDRSGGPWDAAEVDSTGLFDCGGLRLRPVEGMQLALELDQSQQTIQSLRVTLADSSLQLQAFAAPRSGGMWVEIRDEIAAAVVAGGGTAETASGPVGLEVRTRMRSAGPNKSTVFAPVRFLGVDGPRWFLRGVLAGRAAIDDTAAAALLEIFQGVVVVRGQEPMGPRELIPLTVPREVSSAPEGASDDPTAEGGGPPEGDATAEGADTPGDRRFGDLNPFERGPEITEVR